MTQSAEVPEAIARAMALQAELNVMHICIDEDCPSCGWPERWFSVGTGDFGCNKCDHRGKTRTS